MHELRDLVLIQWHTKRRFSTEIDSQCSDEVRLAALIRAAIRARTTLRGDASNKCK